MKKNFLSAALLIAAAIVFLLTCTPFTFGNVNFWFWRKIATEESLMSYFMMLLPTLILFPGVMYVCKRVFEAREFRPVRYHKWIFLLIVPCSLVFQLSLMQRANEGSIRHQFAMFRDSANGVFSEKMISESPAFAVPAEKTEVSPSISTPSDEFGKNASGTCKKAFSRGMFRLCSWISAKVSPLLGKFQSPASKDVKIALAVQMGYNYREDAIFAPLVFLFFSAIAIACCAFLLWRAARRLYGRYLDAVTTRSAINVVQAAVVFTLPVVLFAGRTEAVDFCLACVVTYFIICAFRANVGYCKAGFCALAGLCTGVAVAYDIIFLLFVPFMAALLFCRHDWRRGRVPMVLFCMGGLVFFIAVWAYGNVNLFTETAQRFQEAYQGVLYPESVKLFGLQIPYNLFSLFVFTTPMAFMTAFCSRHLFVKKYRLLSIHCNLFAWAAAALVLVVVTVPFVFGVTGAATLAVIPVLTVLALQNIFEARDEMPLQAFQTALFGQVLLVAVLHIFYQIPLSY